MGRNFRWMSETPHLFTGSLRSATGGKRHAVVEAVPGGGWDWTAWVNDGSGQARHGRADRLGKAIAAAEHGAMALILKSGAALFASGVNLVLHEAAAHPM